MTFTDSFDDFMSLYTEGYNPNDKAYNRTPEEQAAINKKKDTFAKNSKEHYQKKKVELSTRGAKEPSDSSWLARDEEKTEDNETAKKIGKGAAKLAGKAALGTAKLAVKGALKVGKELGHFVTDDDFRGKVEDCESCGCSDEEVEDCETCGCEENPEYGHFDDKFSDYIDQYEEPAEDGERVDKDKMKCNSPKRGGSKKFVVKACENGKEKVVRFGDPNMRIRKSNPKARKSFRARHKCDQKKSKFSAGYWSCKKW